MSDTSKILRNIIIYIFAIFVIVIGLSKTIQFLSHNKDLDENDKWVDVVGTLTALYHGPKSLGSEFSYSYKNNHHQTRDKSDFSMEGNIIGEKYLLRINPEKPDYYFVVRWKPLFTDDEIRNKSVCTVRGIVGKIEPNVRFKYSVNGSEYSRGQGLPPNYMDLYPNLTEGNSYEVEYWIENPQRAIVHLDKPVKK